LKATLAWAAGRGDLTASLELAGHLGGFPAVGCHPPKCLPGAILEFGPAQFQRALSPP